VALPEVTGNGYETIQRMLDGRLGLLMLAALLLAKSAATVSSVSSGSPGGVFTPSMFLGAALGGMLGQAADAISGTHASGGYVLVGMAALVAATTHAPLMATVLGFELSGDYGVVLPLLLGTAIATVVSRRASRESIYTAELIRRGIPWEGTLGQRLARVVRAEDILEKDPLTVDGRAPAIKAAAMLLKSRARVVYVLAGTGIKALDLRLAARVAADSPAEGILASEVAVPVPSVAPDTNLLDLSEKLWSIDWGELPVADPREPSRLLGIVSRRAILGALDRELLQRDLLYTRVVTFEGGREAADYLELPAGYRVEVIAPPATLIGRVVDSCRIRTESGVIVVGMRRGEVPAGQTPAWSELDSTVLQSNDRLLVLGRTDTIERFRAGTHPSP
jgi:CIC family chloride channel protein